MSWPISTCASSFLGAIVVTSWIAKAETQISPLPRQLVFDYQLSGDYPLPKGMTVVVRDSTASPEPGLFNICYVNGFQTQPGAIWPAELLVPGPDGQPLADLNWPDEFLIDVSTANSRSGNFALVLPMLEICRDKGFDAVEFDNLDSYLRSEGYMSLEDSIAFATLLVEAAHGMNLAAGQKNTPELEERGRDVIGFDFAIAEECYRWGECAAYTDVYGDRVIAIEYADALKGSFADACADPERPNSMILRDRYLVLPSDPAYVYQRC